jgi:predicted deacetylase
MAKFIIRVDDVCPTMGHQFEEFSETLIKLEVPCLIGIVPACKDPELLQHAVPRSGFWDFMRKLKANGWTICQHGYTHVFDCHSRDLFDIMRRSEFAGHDFEAQVHRLASGAKILADEGLATDIFMAPNHAFDAVTIKALQHTGFKYVSDGFAFWPYEEGGLTHVPQIFHDPRNFGVGIYTICLHLDKTDQRNFRKILQFISCNTHRIIRFEDAAQFTKNGAIAMTSRRLLEFLSYSRNSIRMWQQGGNYI